MSHVQAGVTMVAVCAIAIAQLARAWAARGGPRP